MNLVSALDIYEDDEPELLLCYNRKLLDNYKMVIVDCKSRLLQCPKLLTSPQPQGTFLRYWTEAVFLNLLSLILSRLEVWSEGLDKAGLHCELSLYLSIVK